MCVKVIVLLAFFCIAQAEPETHSSSEITEIEENITSDSVSLNPAAQFFGLPGRLIGRFASVTREAADEIALGCLQDQLSALNSISVDMIEKIQDMDQRLTEGKPESDLTESQKIQRDQLNIVIGILSETKVEEAFNEKNVGKINFAFNDARRRIFNELHVVARNSYSKLLSGDSEERRNATLALRLIADFHAVSFSRAQKVTADASRCFIRGLIFG